jgi:hypothetical protein
MMSTCHASHHPLGEHAMTNLMASPPPTYLSGLVHSLALLTRALIVLVFGLIDNRSTRVCES